LRKGVGSGEVVLMNLRRSKKSKREKREKMGGPVSGVVVGGRKKVIPDTILKKKKNCDFGQRNSIAR